MSPYAASRYGGVYSGMKGVFCNMLTSNLQSPHLLATRGLTTDSLAIDALQKMVQGKFRHLPVVEMVKLLHYRISQSVYMMVLLEWKKLLNRQCDRCSCCGR